MSMVKAAAIAEALAQDASLHVEAEIMVHGAGRRAEHVAARIALSAGRVQVERREHNGCAWWRVQVGEQAWFAVFEDEGGE